MAIAFFRISKLPIRVGMEIDSSVAVLNESHAIALENTVEFDNQSGFKGEFLDDFEIQVSEDGVKWSAPAIIPIKDLVLVNTPESADAIITAAINNSYVPYPANLAINNSTDRILITAINGLGQWQLNGQSISVGQYIQMHDLPNLRFVSSTGAGLPYSTLSYQCANHVGLNDATTYTITINIASLAQIALGSQSINNGNVLQITSITDGLSNTIAQVEIVTTGTMFANGPASTVTINYNSESLEISANETNVIDVRLDGNGNANIDIEHNYSNFGTPAVSNVQLTVQEVDGNSANVSGTDEITSTVNYT